MRGVVTLVWLDCSAGVAGDMLLGALLDAGAPLEPVRSAVRAVDDRIELRLERTARHGIAAARLVIDAGSGRPERRTWRDVAALLEQAQLETPVRARALDVFGRLARVEGTVHGVHPADVHFHEVGALDAIADVVGVCAAVHALGLIEVSASAVTLGSGHARGEHGVVPVPGPAVLALLAQAGAPVHGGPVPLEMTTPTGAALLASLVTRWGPLPPMTVAATGYGAGHRDPAELPNLVRVVLGEAPGTEPGTEPAGQTYADPPGTAVLLETNVDDLDPRLWPAVIVRLLATGASDAWLTPIVMKKGRPAHTLSVLVPADRAQDVRRCIFEETSTIGLREQVVGKRALDRREATVTVAGQPVRVKLAMLGGAVLNAQPEYEDVAAAAAALGLPVKAVLARANAAAHAAGLLP